MQIKPEKHLVDPSQPLQIGQLVSIKMPPNLVDHGLYIAVGDAGSINSSDSPQDFTVVQLYFNVNPEGVLLLLDSFTKQLNTLKIPFDFKIAYDEADFPRLDGAVLEFKSADFARLRPLLKKLYQETQAHFQPEIPFFCKQLELGLGLAEKPQAPDSEPENIGQHHCGIIAKALLEAWQQGNQSSTDKLNYVLNCLSKEGVDLKYLYLNPDSKDIYDL